LIVFTKRFVIQKQTRINDWQIVLAAAATLDIMLVEVQGKVGDAPATFA
jgi:hypothetical protein